jgi:hypothetical protein
MEKTHAILLPNQLRTLDDNLLKFLDSCNHISKIFIVTERGFEKEAQLLYDRYDADISFIEDLAYIETGVPLSEPSVFHPEFIKLEYALRYLILWEQKNNHCFQYIHRFRTDIAYPINFQDYIKPLYQSNFPENMLLLYHALNYSGPRKTMLKLIGFLDYYYKYKKDKEFFKEAIVHLDINALSRSEYDRCDHFGNCFPVGLLASEDKIPNFHLSIKNEYSSYIEAAVAFVKRIRSESRSDELYDYFTSWDTKLIRVFGDRKDWFPHWPENIFFRYINYNGLATMPYPVKNQYNDTPMKFSRHATTPFTVKIFNLLQERNYSFLEVNYPWEEEIALYLATGGDSRNALQKFTLLNLSSLSDASCVTLYRIIDLLNQPAWLMAYRKPLIEQIMARGINPPKTLS